LLGWTPIEATDEHFKASFQVDQRFLNPVELVHGGFIAAMLDDVMSPAGQTLLGPDQHLATLEMKINFLRPAAAGRFIGEGRVVRRGRAAVFMEGSLMSEDGSLIATATETALVVSGPAGSGKG
jgi:uncharacterized protein (TIGR00369 family)